MKNNLILFFAAAAVLLCGCSSGNQTRNIALNRAATATSNYDYNLTAQLVTDGVITDVEPSWLKVSTAQGELPKREKEWTVDQGPFSATELEGSSNFLEYEWSGCAFSAGCVRVTGSVAMEKGTQASPWAIKCYAAGDAAGLIEVGAVSGQALPGVGFGTVTVNDPNKAEGTVDLPQRLFIYEIPVNCKDFSHFKIDFNMDGARFWKINSVDFIEGKSFGKNTDSGRYYNSKEARGFSVLPSETFTSAWMSADDSPQSIVVDLGVTTNIRGLRLHWIHGCETGTVEVSTDGKDWRRSAEFSGAKGLVQDITASGKARYVRLSMSGADESGHFCLSEMEVMGAAKRARAEQWALQRYSLVQGGGESISTQRFDVSGWMPAVVPGTVLYSYMAAGAVPDPAIADNNQQISESYFNSDFWYRGVLPLKVEAGRRAFLEFDGINWKADVYMNGKYLGKIEGAFKRAFFDVTDIAGEQNYVAVHLYKNANYGAVKEKNVESPDFNGGLLGADNPTFHATVGWDWIPTVRGREIGIWNDVRLVSSPDWKIYNPLVCSVVDKNGKADVTPSAVIANLSDKPLKGKLCGGIGEIEFEKEIALDSHQTAEVSFSPNDFSQLKASSLALWWPNGMGEQALHDAWYTFVPDGAALPSVHDIDYKAGIREFTYTGVMTDLNIFVNGHRFFPKGGNWGFSEFNLRYADKYDTAVKEHKEMHLNMIRNWVGQTGDEEFYDACDKYGVVVWQDFWLANPADGPDPDDEEMFADNARDYVGRIRSHASIGLYCGRNEGYPPATLNAELQKIVSDLHPGIVYIPNSADDGVSGHGPYRAVNPDQYFATPALKFHSERGMPAVMRYGSLEKLFGGVPSWPNDDVWGQHDFTINGAQGDVAFLEMVQKGFGSEAMASIENFARFAQWVNYDGYRAMYEANNAGRKGLLIWMSHSCWPSLAWQTYDYWFDRNGAWYGTQKACEPLHIQFNPVLMTVQVVDESLESYEGLTASISLAGVDGAETYSRSSSVAVGEDSLVNAIDCRDIPDGPCIMTLTLADASGKVLSENRYLRNYKDGRNTGDYTAFSEETLANLFRLCGLE